MSELTRLQQAFAGALSGATTEVPECIAPSSRAFFDVYRNNVLFNRAGALDDVYPVIRAMVGDAFFEALALEYARRTAAGSANLIDYGASFTQFLDDFEPTRELPFLPDVAALEWACHQAYYAPDLAAFEVNRLADIQPDDIGQLRLHLHPACHLLASPWPLASIWNAHQAHGQLPDAFADEAETVLVLRSDNRVCVRAVPAGDAAFIAALIGHVSFGEAVSRGLAHDAGFDAGQVLQQLALTGALSDFSLEDTA